MAFQSNLADRLRQRQAFAKAVRHSSHVRWLRRLIVVGGVGSVAALILLSLLDPFRILPAGVSISRVGLNGTKVTMDAPKLTGFRKDGRSYAVTAKSGIHDVRTPNIIELAGVEARIAMADKSTAQVSAPRGVYNSGSEIMDLSGDVRVRSDAGYDLSMQSATMKFKGGDLASNQPVTLVMTQGTIAADALQITDNGHAITFAGNVKSIMLPAAEVAATASSLKGTSP